MGGGGVRACVMCVCVCVCVCVSVCVCMSVCLSVCLSERERERERGFTRFCLRFYFSVARDNYIPQNCDLYSDDFEHMSDPIQP